jgi:hypothetical protein
VNHNRDPVEVWDTEDHATWTPDDYATLCGRAIGMLRFERAARDEWPGREPEYEIPLVPVCADCFKPGELVTTPSGVRVCRDCWMGENYRER